MVHCECTCCLSGGILESLLFNLILCDVLLLVLYIDFDSYSDDNTPCIISHSIDYVLEDVADVVQD